MGRPKKHYVVQRLSWRVWEHNGPVAERRDDDRGVPVRAFASRAAADRLCRHLSAEARREVAPFRFESGELELLTSLPEKAFLAKLKELGVPRPRKPRKGDYIRWASWWDDVSGALTDEQRDAVWGLLDLLTLYEVVAVEEFG
jgi:hypothetical protein